NGPVAGNQDLNPNNAGNNPPAFPNPGYVNLVLGDLNHDGLANDGLDLTIPLPAAQAILTSAVTGDARLIVFSQAIAAQLNEYNDLVYDQKVLHTGNGHTLGSGFPAEPNGLIEEAVAWLTGSASSVIPTGGQPGDAQGSNVDTNHDGLLNGPITGGPTPEYSIVKGNVVLNSTKLSSNSPAFQQH